MIIVLIIIALLIFLFFKFFAILHDSNLVLVTGGLKCGKTAFSLLRAIKCYKKNYRIYKIKNFLIKIINVFRKNKLPYKEEPILYSNIPLANVKFSTIDIDLILLKKRMPPKSVMFIDEASLFADSMQFKNQDINDKMLLFNKLFAHITHGGSIYYNTQCLQDLHFSIKRCVSSYYYINSLVKLPFFLVFNVREMLYCGDSQNVINATDETIEGSCKKVLALKSIFKKYDRYCYSVFTDNKNLYINKALLNKKDSLKTDFIVSLKDYSKYFVDTKKGVIIECQNLNEN